MIDFDDKMNDAQKVVMLGESAVGKTSVVLQLNEHVFRAVTAPTVGSGVITKSFETPKGTINLNIWDTAGEERYRSFTGLYSQNANAGIIVFDLTDVSSFEIIPDWIKTFLDSSNPDALIYIIGNKLDLDSSRAISYDYAFDWCKQQGYSYSEVSAKTGENIDLVFNQIAEELAVKQKSHKQGTVQGLETSSKSNDCPC